MIMSALATFKAWIWVGFGTGNFLFVNVLKTISPQKLHVLGACLHLAVWLLHCVPVVD
jgi:hypothetical protein